MVTDVSGVETRIAVFGRSVLVVALLLVIGGVAQVGVIEVQTPRLLVMIGRFMHVRCAGHEAEPQIDGTTAQREDPAHPSELNRIHGQGAMRYSMGD